MSEKRSTMSTMGLVLAGMALGPIAFLALGHLLPLLLSSSFLPAILGSAVGLALISGVKRALNSPSRELPAQTDHSTPGQQEAFQHRSNARGRTRPELRITTDLEPPMQELQPLMQQRPLVPGIDEQSPQRRFSAQNAVPPVSPVEREWPLPPQRRDYHGPADGSISPDGWLEDRTIAHRRPGSPPRPKDDTEQHEVTRKAPVHTPR